MIVVDANVLLAALRSSRGASHRLLREMLMGAISFAVSPAVALEYEDVLKRPGILGDTSPISVEEIDTILDAVFSRALLVSPSFRFRPFLDDRKTTFISNVHWLPERPASSATTAISGTLQLPHSA